MSRYLTPSKISLLILITLYVESAIPASAILPLLSFIVYSILPARGATIRRDSTTSRVSANSLEVFRNLTISHASGIPGRTLWDLLLKKLWELNCFDSLHVFFDSLPSLLLESHDDVTKERLHGLEGGVERLRLARTSPLGIFVRRAHLEFVRLQLHGGVSLWKSFAVYREPTRSLWRRRNPKLGRTGFDINLPDGFSSALHRVLYEGPEDKGQPWIGGSTEDAERLLDFQVEQMQRLGDRISDEMRRRYEDMVQTSVTIPSVSHYVRFLDAWKAGDYASAFDNLHRFFDYTMHNKDRTFYQYALLNLAMLQADFGCFTEAVAAVQETIATARENKDMACLNYSLSWLYHFGKAHPEEVREVQKSGVLGTDKEALAFLKAKSRETSMWNLLSTSLLSEAKVALMHGESLSWTLENITKASHLSAMKTIPNAVGNQMTMRSSLFSRLGVSYLSWSTNEIFLECYANSSPIEDELHFLCKKAWAASIQGRYGEALETMESASLCTLNILKFQQYWGAYSGLLKLQNSLHKNDLTVAEHFLSQIRANPAPNHDISYSTAVHDIDLQLRKGDHSKAMTLLERQSVKMDEKESDIFQRVKLMILKARLYEKAGLPHKGFSVAARAASMAYSAHLLPALWESIGGVCRIMISLKDFEAAVKIMRSIMPQVIECDDCEMASDSFSILADAHMGAAGAVMVGAVRAGLMKRKEHVSKALEYVGRAFDGYSRISDIKGQCEMMAKRAAIMCLHGDITLAFDYAARYLAIQKNAREEIIS